MVAPRTPNATDIHSQRLAVLVNELLGGRNMALTPLLELYRPYLLATAARRFHPKLKAKAGPSDLVQETIAEAHAAYEKLEQRPTTDDEIRHWLRGILLDRLKALKRRYFRAKRRSILKEHSMADWGSRELFAKLTAGADQTPGGILDRQAELARVDGAMQKLPAAYQQIILWRNRDGRRFVDIATQLDRSPDAVRMLWKRAMKQLKKELGLNDES